MREPNRVLIVYNSSNDSRSVSGVLKHFLLAAKAWMAEGWTVDFLASRAGLVPIRDFIPEAGLISSDNIFSADRHIGRRWAYFPAYGWRLVTAHFTRLKQYDVVIASSPVIFEVYPALVIKRRQGAALVAKFHHVLTAQAKRTGLMDRLFLWSERRAMRWINQHAEGIIASTAPVKRDVKALERSMGLPEREIVQIGYGLDMDLFFLPDPAPRYDVVMLGRIHEQKGVFDLPEIWAEVLKHRPEARLLLIGEGADRPRLEAALEKAGLRGSITHRGGVPEREKNQLLAQSRIGLSLSFEEGWGLSINEYLATGLPVVAYDLPIYHDVFPGLLLSAPPGEKGWVARKILELLDSPAVRAEWGSRGREYVRRYDYREIARREAEAMVTAWKRRPTHP